MKVCPKCKAQYGYDMSFCLEDGTPLETVNAGSQADISENTVVLPQTSAPKTTAVESISEETLVLPQDSVPQTNIGLKNDSEKTMYVQPTIASTGNPVNQSSDWSSKQSNPPPQDTSNPPFLSVSEYESEPQKSKTGLLIGSIAAGLLLIGSIVGAVFYFQGSPSKEFASANTANINNSASPETSSSQEKSNVDAAQISLGNSNSGKLSNSSEKTNSKPTATTENIPKSTPTIEDKQNVETEEPKPTKMPTPLPPSPKPTSNQPVSGGVINGKAVRLVQPAYPAAARAVRASGAVNVQVTIDENGDVVAAYAVSGHSMLRLSAEQAARASKFSPSKNRMTGTIVYNYAP